MRAQPKINKNKILKISQIHFKIAKNKSKKIKSFYKEKNHKKRRKRMTKIKMESTLMLFLFD
jgi:hypothetical protein